MFNQIITPKEIYCIRYYKTMPKTPIDYSKALIYKIVCTDVNVKECYIGSTTDFRKRKNSHKHTCETQHHKNHNFYVYKFIRENGGWGNWDVVIIEYYPCVTKLELHARERYHIEHLNAQLNCKVPMKTSGTKSIEN